MCVGLEDVFLVLVHVLLFLFYSGFLVRCWVSSMP